MGIFKKPKDDGKKKPVKVVPVKITQKKNPSMWCTMHNCSKLACPKMHD